MKRRRNRRGRLIVALGAVLSLAGLPLVWWAIARINAPSLSGTGFEGVGIVIFLAALATLAVLVLPYASRDGESSLDRALLYALLELLGGAAFVFRLFEISQFAALSLPLEAPGLWLTGAGLVIGAWGVGDLVTDGSRADSARP